MRAAAFRLALPVLLIAARAALAQSPAQSPAQRADRSADR